MVTVTVVGVTAASVVMVVVESDEGASVAVGGSEVSDIVVVVDGRVGLDVAVSVDSGSVGSTVLV